MRTIIAVYGEHEIARLVRNDDSGFFRSDIEKLGADVLKAANVWNEPDDFRSVKKVKFFEMKAVKDQLQRVLVFTDNIIPRCRERTPEEYDEECESLTGDLPPEFAQYVLETAYERGHYAGHEEVLNYVRSISYGLKPVVDSYTKRIKG